MLNKHIHGQKDQANGNHKNTENLQNKDHPKKKISFSPEHAKRNKETYQTILQLNLEGLNNREISETLNAQGIPSLSGTGKWFPASVGRVLNETPVYMKE